VYQTNQYEGMLAETVTYPGQGGELINAYLARPLGAGPFPAMVLVHHMPGWDECPSRLCYHLAQSLLPRRPWHAGRCCRHGAGGRRCTR
jgi:hypothetical protein